MIICTIQEIHPTKHSITSIWPVKVSKGQISSKVKDHEVNWKTYYMCFMKTLVIICTIQKIQPNKNSIIFYLSSKVKGLEVNWNTIYDLLYVFHIDFGHDMHDSADTGPLKTQLPQFDI